MSPTHDPSPPERRDRLLQEHNHDPYQTRKKLPEPAVCADCGALFHAGRWQWGEAPGASAETTCPACQRIRDRCPAGFFTLGGDFFRLHREEIVQLVRNLEGTHRTRHPLKRLMGMEELVDGGLTLTFTDPDLARAAGEAVRSAYQGELEISQAASEYLIRVRWSR